MSEREGDWIRAVGAVLGATVTAYALAYAVVRWYGR
jgi:hypothetical protein